ncbi:MAG: hypothetical protein MJY60_04245 [Bacteroidales bacterium]|nr:hypothetical protein [Bacteroidales bacterium]
MWISATIAFILLAVYVAYIIRNYGIPTSLSRTFYLLGERGWLFSVVMSVMGFATMIPMMSVTPDNFKCVPFICGCSLCFVGVASEYAQRVASGVHLTAAVIGMLCSLAWVIIMGCWWVLPITLAVAAIPAISTRTIKSCWVWWLEVAVLLSVFLTMIITL